ncbi:MAG TPA: HD domain-containing phosphohydrolase [Chloroflexota bacterium]|jgi:ribonuclease P protein subunit RPR2
MEHNATHGIDDHSIRALAHELRTPLTSLLGYAQLLQRDDRIADPALQRDGLSLIESRALKLAEIVGQLTAFADPAMASTRLEHASTSGGLGEMVEGLAGDHVLTVEITPEADHAAVDRDTVAAVLRELLENASRHGRADQPIQVQAALAGRPRRLVLRVTNEGQPIPAGARATIFEPFGKAGEDFTQRDPGIGLGLAVARRLAEAANGGLSLEADAPTTFRLELPITHDPIAARLRAMNERAALAESEALEAAQMLEQIRVAPQSDQVEHELAVAHERQLQAVEDFRRLHRQAIELTGRLDRVYLEITAALARAVEARDQYTGSHVERVSRHAVRIARSLGLGDEALRQIEFGGVLHDVGKIGVPDAVLGKPGALTPEEWETMRRHPIIGRSMLQGIAFLGPAVDAVAHHHERWDGDGYPFGLAGDEIPLAGRIVSVADAFDAMTTDRPYRRGLSTEVAVAELERGKGTAFDVDVVGAFLGTIGLAS